MVEQIVAGEISRRLIKTTTRRLKRVSFPPAHLHSRSALTSPGKTPGIPWPQSAQKDHSGKHGLFPDAGPNHGLAVPAYPGKNLRETLGRGKEPSMPMMGQLVAGWDCMPQAQKLPYACTRMNVPCLMRWADGFGVVVRSDANGLLMAHPRLGWLNQPHNHR